MSSNPVRKSQYQERVRNERSQLAQRLDKLKSFLKGSALDDCNDAERDLLELQREAMQNYLDILDERIEDFN